MTKTKIARFATGDAVTVWAGPRMGIPLERRSVVKVTRDGYQLDNGSEWVDRGGASEVASGPSAFRLGASGKRGGLLLRTDVRAETEALLRGIDWSCVGDKALAEVVSALTRGGRWPVTLAFGGAGEEFKLSPTPFEGETLGAWRTRAGRRGSDTVAAQSIAWHEGCWKRIEMRPRAEDTPKTLGEVCVVLHGLGLHALCKPSDYVSEDGMYVAGLSIYEGDLPGLMRAIGPGWVHEEVKRETLNGLLCGAMLVVNIRPAQAQPKTLDEVMSALAALQFDAGHDYIVDAERQGLKQLRMDETVVLHVTAAVGRGWTFEEAGWHKTGDGRYVVLFNVFPTPSASAPKPAPESPAHGLLVPGQTTHTVRAPSGPCRRLDCPLAACADEAHRLTLAMSEELRRCIDYPQPNHGAGTVRLHIRLRDLRLVEIRDDGGMDHAFATKLGREVYARWKALPARPKVQKGAR